MTSGHYEDAPEYPADAYTVVGWGGGIAWRVLGWETEPDNDTEWTGIEERTGRLVCMMIGDDKRFAIDPAHLAPIDERDYCHVCGQVGCTHDGIDRTSEETS